MSKLQKSENASGPSPFGFFGAPFMGLHDDMDRLFHSLSAIPTPWRAPAGENGGQSLGLRVDVAETEKEIHITADLPGVDEDDLEVTLDDDVLRIRAERRHESDRKDKDWRVVERSYGVFERALRMPAGVDPGKVNAQFEKGVLTVTLPKPPEPPSVAKRIKVKAKG